MAITAAEREDILELLVVMFNAAPGPYLDDVVAVYEALGHNLPALANALGNTAIFQSLHPNFQTADEFATDLLSTFGLEGDAAAREWAIASFNAGMTKAQIMFVAWNYLEDLPDDGPAAYVTARDIMRNKAEVSEYYSVVVEGDGETIEELQDVVADVDETQDSVEAAIEEIDDDLATGPALTAGVDDIEFFGNDPIRVTGVVDGDEDGSTSGSTYNPGDRIQGNTNTEVDLTVVEVGEAGFVQMFDVDVVNVYAATANDDDDVGITFNGAGWNNVGGVSLNDGINGLTVGVTNLEVAEDGTTLEVANVTGTVWAEFDNNIGVAATRWDDGDTPTSISIDLEANLDADLGDNGGAYVWEVDNDDEAVVGDVTVTGGESSTFSIDLDSEESTVGDVTVTLGDEGLVKLRMHDVETAASFGNVNVTLGDSATMSFTLTGDDEGAAEAGNITATAGAGTSYLDVFVEDFATVDFGDISLTTAGLNLTAAGPSSAGVEVAFYDNDSVTVGNITATVGAATGTDGTANEEIEVEFLRNAGTTTIENVTLTGGSEADVQLYIGSSGTGNGTEEVAAGDVSVTAGAGAYGYVTVEDHNQTEIGDITVSSGGAADVFIEGESWLTVTEDDAVISGTASNITVGNVSATATGAATYAEIEIRNWNDDNEGEDGESTSGEGASGNIVAGDLSATATGTNSDATVIVMNGSIYAPTAEEEIDAVGSITVEDVSAQAGSETAIDNPDTVADETTTVSAEIHIENNADNGSTGNVTVGSASVTVGNGFVSGAIENDVEGDITILNLGEDGVGNTDVGDVNMTGGNFADLDATIVQNGPSTGNLSVGVVEVDAGESAEIMAMVMNDADGEDGTVGALDVDGVDIAAEQDSTASVTIVNSLESGLESGGFDLGDVDIVMGDNSTVSLVAVSDASYFSEDPEAEFVDGDFVVGNVDIAVSATTTADLAGDGNISVIIGKRVEGDVTTGSVTVGDITLSAFGPGSDVWGSAGILASAPMVGDVDVGTVTLNIGSGAFDDDLSADDAFFAVGAINEGGDVGNVSVEGVTIDAGASSVVTFLVGAGSMGDVGVIDAGDADLTAAADAMVMVEMEIEAGEDSTVDGITVGDVMAEVNGDGAVSYIVAETLDVVGAVAVGEIEADVNSNGTFTFVLDLEATTIGGVTVDGADVTVGDGGMATVLVDLDADTATGNVTVGDLVLSLDDQDADEDEPVGGAIYVNVIHSGSDDDNVTVGDVIVDVAGGAGDEIQVTVVSDSGADIAIGDVVATGEGDFVITNEEPGSTGSFLYVATGGAVSIGNVDFSAYGADSDVDLDLSWVRTGAGQILTGEGDDTIVATDGDNVITAGGGVDTIDIRDTDTNVSVTDGGNDTIVTNNGDSGETADTVDTVTGFAGATGDRLDFNLVAGSSTNYVESAADAGTFAQFLLNADDALNNTGGVRYYAQEVGDSLFVAVNYGSGDVDMVIELVGVTVDQFQASYIVA